MKGVDLRELSAAAQGAFIRIVIDHADCVVNATSGSNRDTKLDEMMRNFCESLPGLPIQEVADHGVLRFIHENREPVAGIALPQNASPQVAIIQDLVRAAYKQFVKEQRFRPQENTYVLSESESWAVLDTASRHRKVDASAAEALTSWDLPADSVTVSEVTHGSRFTVAFSAQVPISSKPALLMRLERELRARLDRSIELFVADVKDENALRRL